MLLVTANFFLILFCLNFEADAFSLMPKVIHGVNGMWFSLKGRVTGMVDCMTEKRKPTVDDVQFYLYTSKNKESPEVIKALYINKSKNFNDKFFTKVLIHGYTQSYKSEQFIKMKDVYVATEILNVIMVNWENLADSPCYPIAADYTGFVGQLTGYLLEKLLPEKVHVIGFSLGAHVGGLAGKMQMKKILRITGLDPAAPMFFNNPETKRLDKSDAQNVDIIHTSIAGIGALIGHADFIVNGGKAQPSCSATDVTCSHKRSLELYLESITSNVGFKATMCESLNNFETNKCSHNTFIPMGEPWLASGAMRGTFYINTNSTAPYALDEQPNSSENETDHETNESGEQSFCQKLWAFITFSYFVAPVGVELVENQPNTSSDAITARGKGIRKRNKPKSHENKKTCGCLAIMYKTSKKSGNKVTFEEVSQTRPAEGKSKITSSSLYFDLKEKFWSRKNKRSGPDGKGIVEKCSNKEQFHENSIEASTSTSFSEKLFDLFPFRKSIDSKSDQALKTHKSLLKQSSKASHSGKCQQAKIKFSPKVSLVSFDSSESIANSEDKENFTKRLKNKEEELLLVDVSDECSPTQVRRKSKKRIIQSHVKRTVKKANLELFQSEDPNSHH